MFYIIGLGLADEKDVTLRGLEVLATSLGVCFS
jgi:diphthamide biosynthesis methyltransferase